MRKHHKGLSKCKDSININFLLFPNKELPSLQSYFLFSEVNCSHLKQELMSSMPGDHSIERQHCVTEVRN